MSFAIVNQHLPAQEIAPEVQFQSGSEREAVVLAIIERTLVDLAHALGGFCAISSSGHVGDQPLGEGGDNVNIQINTILAPPKPVVDAGLESNAGSPRNFPPEASTAAPATADGSPPAAQEPIPQPVPPGEAPAEQASDPVVEDVPAVDVSSYMVDDAPPDPTSEPPVDPAPAEPAAPLPLPEPAPSEPVASPVVDPAPENPAPPVVAVEVVLDAQGNGWSVVNSPPAAFVSVSLLGVGSVRYQGVEGEPSQTCVIVHGGVPLASVEAHLVQATPPTAG